MPEKRLRRTRVAERLENELREQIRSQQLRPGDLILSMSELSARYRVKRPTVQKALERLEREGYLRSRPGSGTYVSDTFRTRQIRLYSSRSSAIGDFLNRRLQETKIQVRRVERPSEADVVCGSGGTARLLERRGGLLPLEEMLRKEAALAEPSGWVSEVADLYRIDGHVRGLPVFGSPLVIFFNRQLFKKAGLSEPKADWRWKDFAKTVAALRPVCDLDRAGVFPFMDLFTLYVPFVLQNGGQLFTWDGRCRLDEQEAVETVLFLREVRHRAGGTICGDYGELATRFLGGGCAMALWSGLLAQELSRESSFEWGWVPLPCARRRATLIFSEGFMVRSATADPETGWRFVRECLSEASQGYFVEQHFPFPARRSAVQRFLDEHGTGYRRFLGEMRHAVTEHYRHGPEAFGALHHEMRGFLDHDRSDREARDMCARVARIAEGVIRANRSLGEEQLIA